MKANKIISPINGKNILTEKEKNELLGGISKVAESTDTLSSAKGSDGTYCSQSGLYCSYFAL